MSGTSAKTSSTVEIVNITPRWHWSDLFFTGGGIKIFGEYAICKSMLL